MKAGCGVIALAAVAAGMLAAQEQGAGAWRAAQAACAARQAAAASVQAAAREKVDSAAALQRASADRQVRLATPRAAPYASPELSGCERLQPARVEALVSSAAAREGLQPDLLRAVMERESGFRPCAVSSKGALGLMQLLPSTAAELGVADAFDPAENAASGARFLAGLIGRYGGDLKLALAAYNAGPGRVDAKGTVPDIPETRDYVRDILAGLGLP